MPVFPQWGGQTVVCCVWEDASGWLSVNGSNEFLVRSGSSGYLAQKAQQAAACRGWWRDCLRRRRLYAEELRMNTDLEMFQRMWCVNEAVCRLRRTKLLLRL